MGKLGRAVLIAALGVLGFVALAFTSGPATPTDPADPHLCAQAIADVDADEELWCDPEKSREELDRIKRAMR